MLGAPVVVSDIPENPAMLEDGEVLFFRNGSVEALTDKLVRALDETEELRVGALRGRERLARSFSWEAIASAYHGLYRELLAGGARV